MANLLQNRRQILKRAGVLGGLAALLGSVPALAKSNVQSNVQSSANTLPISGSWRVNITPQGTGSPAPFQGLHTFSGDGTITTAEQRDLVPPMLMSSGHGSWVQLPSNDGPDDFEYTYQKLVVDTHGNLLGTNIVKIKIELSNDRQSFTGKGTSVFQPTNQAPNPDYVFMLGASRI